MSMSRRAALLSLGTFALGACLPVRLAEPTPTPSPSPEPTPTLARAGAAPTRALESCTVQAGTVFIRRKPTRRSAALGVASAGDELRMAGTRLENWTPVFYQERIGYISNHFCKVRTR